MLARVAAVVPAAGQSRRFGAMKLVADVGGEPLLARTIQSLLGAGIGDVVLVTNGVASFEEVAAARDPRVRRAVNRDSDRGMFSSIQVGVAEAQPADVVVVLPADMPFVSSQTIARVIETAARSGRVVMPVYRNRRGHPVAWPARVSTAIIHAAPTSTLKDALAAAGVDTEYVSVDDAGVLRDVDVPADLQADR